MADLSDYGGLDPTIASYLQGQPIAPAMPIASPQATDYGIDPTIQSYLTGQPLMLDAGRKGGEPVHDPGTAEPIPAPVPVPAPAPVPMPAGGTTMGPRGRNNIGEAGGFVGNEIAAPDLSPPSVTGGALPTDPTQVAPTAPAPDLAPVAIPQMSPQQVAAAARFAASPEGQFARADQMKQESLDQGQKSIDDELAATTARNDAAAKATADLQAEQKKKDDAAAVQLAQDQAYHRQLTQQYAQQVKDAADYKVDTDRHVGIGGLIAIALSGIGDALDHRHGPNAAAQIVDAGIDKRIADQWQQKRSLQDKANETKGLMDTAQGQVLDDRTQRQLDTAAAHQQMADAIDATARQYANPIAKARAEQLSADQRAKSGALVAEAAQRGVQARKDAQDLALRQQQLGLESRSQNRADRQFAFEQKKWQDQLDMQKQALEAQGKSAEAKALQDKADKTQQEGVFDPRTGDGLLDPQGRDKMAKADQLEAAARSIADPATQQAAREQAQRLRADARFSNVYTIKDPTARKEVVDNVAANQKLVDAIGRVKQTLAQDPSSVDRATWAALKTDVESAKASWIAAHGGKPSSREFEAISDMFGDDPESMAARLAGRGKIEASLDELKNFAVEDATATLHSHGIKDEWRPREPEVSDPSLSGGTSVGAAEGATPGALAPVNPFHGAATLGHGVYNAITGTKDTPPEVAAENAAPLSSSGLAPKDEQKVRGLMAQAGVVNDAKYADLVNTLAAQAEDPRTGPGVRAVLRENPTLYKQVVSRLPPEQQTMLHMYDAVPGVGLKF